MNGIIAKSYRSDNLQNRLRVENKNMILRENKKPNKQIPTVEGVENKCDVWV